MIISRSNNFNLPRKHSKLAVKKFLEDLDSSKMTILFGTDHHYDDNSTWRKNTLCGWGNISNILHCRRYVDCMILGGDNVDSEHLEKDTNIKNLNHFTDTFLNKDEADRFILRGNHDAGTLQQFNRFKKVELNKVIGREEFKKIFQTEKLNFNETRDNGSLYFYKDYPEKKVRVICIDSIDNPEIIDNNGGLKYFDQWDYGFQERQLKWIAEEALGKCPADFHAVMFSHVPLNNAKSTGREFRRNFDCMKQIISGFVNKQLVTIQSNLTDFEVNFEIDFSKKKETHFAAVVSGHEHWDNDTDMGDYQSIVINRAWPDDVIFSRKEDAFAAIEVDTESRTINVKGFGRALSREIKY